MRVVVAHLDAGRDSYLPMLRPSPWRSADPPNMKTRQDGMASHVAEGDPIKETMKMQRQIGAFPLHVYIYIYTYSIVMKYIMHEDNHGYSIFRRSHYILQRESQKESKSYKIRMLTTRPQLIELPCSSAERPSSDPHQTNLCSQHPA